jgi:UDP-N-acetylmuramate--alanine ligase
MQQNNQQQWHPTPMPRIRRIHFIGIGGAGMSGIAEILLNEGYTITGSDLNTNVTTERLKKAGATIFAGHVAENVAGADVVVVSSAIKKENPEIAAALEARIPIVPRAQMLAELMRNRYGIAIAGTHGKTTTTSLVASIFAQGNLDPTFVIGGLLNSVGSHAHLGKGRYLVAEADESDASFLHLHPMATIVTNIDADHMSTYNNSMERLYDTFIQFLHALPFYGLAVLCGDDEGIRKVLPRVQRLNVTYGFNVENDVQLLNYQQEGLSSSFVINHKPRKQHYSVELNMPGRHNALNAAAAMIVALEEGVAEQDILTAFKQFSGVGRRMQIHPDYQSPKGSVSIIDDYGHHPRELAATISALREGWPERRLVMVFQPHRYSRTHDLFEDFAAVLSEVDVLLMLEVYSAGEPPIPGIDSRALCRSIRARGKVEPIFVADSNEIKKTLDSVLEQDDVVLFQGAGTVGQLPAKLLK